MFRDRVHAGRLLAEELSEELVGRPDAVVFGIPRGGVIVAAQIAHKLSLPLDVIVTSKIGAPGNPEYAIGAVDPDGAVTQNVCAGYSMPELERLGRPVRDKVRRRLDLYRPGRGLDIDVEGRTVVLVDDGIATGLTTFAAVDYLRSKGVARLILAVPVISADAAQVMRSRVDRLVALEEPEVFYAVGQFYREFGQTSDDEVLHALGE